MKKIKKIQLGFENCEVMDFTAKDVAYAMIDGVSQSYLVCENDYVVGQNDCDRLVLELNADADAEYDPFGSPDEYIKTKFQRIRAYDDITSLALCYEDGTGLEICPKWMECSPDGGNNLYQSSRRTESGSLLITVDAS